MQPLTKAQTHTLENIMNEYTCNNIHKMISHETI